MVKSSLIDILPRDCIRLLSAVTGSDCNTKFPISANSLRIIKKDVDKLHAKTFNGLVKLNERKTIVQQYGDSVQPLLERISTMSIKLHKINTLLDLLNADFGHNVEKMNDLKLLLFDLGVSLPEKKIENSKKIALLSAPRKPYVIFRSSDNIVILVGRSAKDNDELSCNREYRKDLEWWMHVHGYSGSHVVIRNEDDNLPTSFPNTVYEAAFLAAFHSKAPQAFNAKVSLTRCKYVMKDKNDPAGRVMLNPRHVDTVVVDIKVLDQDRQNQLLQTKHYE